MPTETGTMTSADGQWNLHTVAWKPDGPVTGGVLLIHGMGEHSGRYAHVAQALNEDGLAVYALDHRGHGRSRGDGPRALITDFNPLVDDCHRRFEQMRAELNTERLFVYGHSMGSIIALLFALRYQAQLKGLIVSGTATRIEDNAGPLLTRALMAIGSLAPSWRIIPAVKNGLAADPKVQQEADNDPLMDHEDRMRSGTLVNIVKIGRDVRNRAQELSLPMLFVHGEDDPMTPLSGAQQLHATISSADKTLKVYPGQLHEVHNDYDQLKVIGDMRTWLSKH